MSIDDIRQDCRYALRTLGRDRAFTIGAIVILALGIGANTAVFSVVDSVLLNPLGYDDPARLFAVHEVIPQITQFGPYLPVNARHFREWKTRSIEMVSGLEQVIRQYPGSFGMWASLLQALSADVPEIVLTGEKINELRTQILYIFIPHRIFQSTEITNASFPLLEGKTIANQPLIFLCKNYACQQPVASLSAFIRLMGTT